jgi:bacterioferritin
MSSIQRENRTRPAKGGVDGDESMYAYEMERDRADQTVAHLDAALSESLAVITQLFLHASILKDRGHRLAPRYYQEWVDTMRRSDNLLQGILALGGRPASREPARLDLGREPLRILELDIALGERWVAALEAAAATCTAEGSNETASMLIELLDAESASLDWRRNQRDEFANGGDEPAPSPSVDGSLIDALNDVLCAELAAITQAYYHGQLFETWGDEKLGEFMAKETWEKTWRSLDLTKHLLAAGGHPAEDGHGQLRIGRDVGEILNRDREFVDSQLAALGTALEQCDSARNPKIPDLLSRMRVGEQKHADWIAAQIDECR